ncbi:MAG: hypothetical protein U0835_12860 [Isosphaeraceae bacterium]
MLVYYFFIKILFFFSIVKALIQFEPLKKHWLFLGVLYSAAVAFLSYVFVINGMTDTFYRSWEAYLAGLIGVPKTKLWHLWLGETLVLSSLYFRLITRFDEGMLFWILFFMGFLLVMF